MTIEQVYKQIDEQRAVLIKLLNQAKVNPISPQRLSDVCMKLGILNEVLGGFVADLKKAQLDKEADVLQAALSVGTSVTGANSLSRTQSAQERYEFMKADIRHSDLWKLISMAQSHIRAVGDGMKGVS